MRCILFSYAYPFTVVMAKTGINTKNGSEMRTFRCGKWSSCSGTCEDDAEALEHTFQLHWGGWGLDIPDRI